ncbi:MAG: hypothetical protein GF399_09795 [Candidatus Coatesbacteria bacterium]|nr:hypothetical protein [Candidatus Coatesbacteria bacterium]
MVKGLVFGAILIAVGVLGIAFQPIIGVGGIVVGLAVIVITIRYRHVLKGPPPNYQRPESNLDIHHKPEIDDRLPSRRY